MPSLLSIAAVLALIGALQLFRVPSQPVPAARPAPAAAPETSSPRPPPAEPTGSPRAAAATPERVPLTVLTNSRREGLARRAAAKFSAAAGRCTGSPVCPGAPA